MITQTNLGFFDVIGRIADILAIATFVSSIVIALVYRSRTLWGYYIALFLSRMFRLAVIVFVGAIALRMCEFAYEFPLALFKGTSEPYVWEEGKEWAHLLAYFTYCVVALVVLWIVATVLWTSSLDQAKTLLNQFLPAKRRIPLEHYEPLTIIKARYGIMGRDVDVTKQLSKMVDRNTLTVKASNSIASDPYVGKMKELEVHYKYGNGPEMTAKVNEGEVLSIEPSRRP